MRTSRTRTSAGQVGPDQNAAAPFDWAALGSRIRRAARVAATLHLIEHTGDEGIRKTRVETSSDTSGG